MSDATDRAPRSTPDSSATVSRFGRRWTIVAAEALAPALLMLAAAISWSAVAWREWIGRDVRIYATIAHFWGEGLLPYRDLYDFKPPMIYLTLRGSFALWGHDAEGFRRLMIVLTTAAALLMYGGLRRAGGRVAAPLTAVAFITLILADPAQIVSQNTEPFAAGFIAAALGCAAAGAVGSRWWALASGLLLGFAAMTKQPAAVLGLPLAFQLLVLENEPRPWRDRFASLLSLAAGAVAVVGSFLVYFAFHHGGVEAFFQAVVVDAAAYTGLANQQWASVLWRPTSPLLWEMLSLKRLWPFRAALALLLPLTFLRPSRWIALAWCWLATSYLVAVLGPRREYHYMIMAFPALAIAVGAVGEGLFVRRRMPWPAGPTGRLWMGTALAFLCFFRPWWLNVIPALGTEDTITPAESEIRELGRRIAQVAAPGDTLFVRDEPHDIYLYANIPPLTRNIYGLTANPQVSALRTTVLEYKPTFITVSLGMESIMWQWKEDAPLAELLQREYEVAIADSPIAVVYRRTRNGGPPVPPWVFAAAKDLAVYPDADANQCPVREAVRIRPPSDLGGRWRGRRIPLGDLEPLATEFDFSPPRKDRAWNGGPLDMNGVKYDRGIGMHAWTRTTYTVPDDALFFSAVIGLAEHARGCPVGRVRFEARDESGRLLYDSGRVDPQTPPFEMTVPVVGIPRLTLVVSPEDDGRDCDHANWARAEFLLPGGLASAAGKSEGGGVPPGAPFVARGKSD